MIHSNLSIFSFEEKEDTDRNETMEEYSRSDGWNFYFWGNR